MLTEASRQFGLGETIAFCDDHDPSLWCYGGLSRLSFEDLEAVPGNVDYVHRRLLRAGNQQRFSSECIHGHAGFAPGYIHAGHADVAVIGDAEDA
ncbi:MAG: hypothetical protein ACRDPF_36705 [Streptosporangiaceae bacterium]